MSLLKESTKNVPINNGKGIDYVQERQRRRKMAMLREGCKQALWFTETFNIDLLKIVFKITATGENIDITYNNHDHVTGTVTNRDEGSQEQSLNLFQIEQILYLLDRFAVSDECYHELSMIDEKLPRSYLIKRTRARINDSIILKKLPDLEVSSDICYSGCYRDLHDCIAEAIEAEVCVYS